MKTRNQGLLLVHLAVLLFGFPGVIGKLLPLTPVQLTWFRVFLASLGLLTVLIWQKEKFGLKKSGDLWMILTSGLLLGLHWTAFFHSVQVSTVAVGMLSYSTFPIFTIFLEPWLLQVKFRRFYLLLALACFLGVALMVPEFRFSNRIFLGVAWGILSGLSFSFLTIINRVLSARYSSLLVAFYQDSLAMVFLMPLFLSSLPSPSFGVKGISLLLFLGLICTAGAHTMFIRGLRFIEARLTSLVSSLEPVYGIVLGYFWLQEVPELRTIFGGLLILASVAIISWQSRSK